MLDTCTRATDGAGMCTVYNSETVNSMDAWRKRIWGVTQNWKHYVHPCVCTRVGVRFCVLSCPMACGLEKGTNHNRKHSVCNDRCYDRIHIAFDKDRWIFVNKYTQKQTRRILTGMVCTSFCCFVVLVEQGLPSADGLARTLPINYRRNRCNLYLNRLQIS